MGISYGLGVSWKIIVILSISENVLESWSTSNILPFIRTPNSRTWAYKWHLTLSIYWKDTMESDETLTYTNITQGENVAEQGLNCLLVSTLLCANCYFQHSKDFPWREWINSSQQGGSIEPELCVIYCSVEDALKIKVRWHELLLTPPLFSNVILKELKHSIWNNLLWKELCKTTDVQNLTRMMFGAAFQKKWEAVKPHWKLGSV